MATTEDAILDRVRDVLVALGYTEAVTLDFTRLPAGAHDGVFTAALSAVAPIGGTALTEEARAVVTVEVSQTIDGDYPAARRSALQRGRAVVNAIVRDGSITSGEYAVEDGGRTLDILAPKGAAYLVARARVPVNYEALL